MNVLAIIPARGGSKGLARKNVLSLASKPLIAHSIEAALEARSVGRVTISTDDAEIATVAKRFGAEVVWRPVEISDDAATSESALLHVLEHLSQTEGYEPDLVVFLQCTSPVRRPSDIDGAVNALLEAEADSLLSVVPTHRFLWEVRDGVPRSVNYDYHNRPRRQDARPQYVENGSIYVFQPWVLREHANRLGGRIALYVMDERSGVEIDSGLDFAVVEALLQEIAGTRKPERGAAGGG